MNRFLKYIIALCYVSFAINTSVAQNATYIKVGENESIAPRLKE